MNNDARDKAILEERFAEVFEQLHEQDIEQFYAHYQLWVLRRRLPMLQHQLESLREHLAENQRVIAGLRPSALALAVLVRLQSNGVNDTDVLDLMLDRGEDWLDRMMQRLDYCEQVEDFIQGDYTQWCIRSLEGAYDWIDSLLGSIKEEPGYRERLTESSEATEELLLQKLSQDDEEAMLNVTAKRPSIETQNPAPSSTESLPISEGELEPASASETPIAAEAVEAEQELEPEKMAELLGWKDLEDLEAPGGIPLPWYSVDVMPDGATSETAQSTSMNDWIHILQAETTTEETENTMLPSPPVEALTTHESATDASETQSEVSSLAENQEFQSVQLTENASTLEETEQEPSALADEELAGDTLQDEIVSDATPAFPTTEQAQGQQGENESQVIPAQDEQGAPTVTDGAEAAALAEDTTATSEHAGNAAEHEQADASQIGDQPEPSEALQAEALTQEEQAEATSNLVVATDIVGADHTSSAESTNTEALARQGEQAHVPEISETQSEEELTQPIEAALSEPEAATTIAEARPSEQERELAKPVASDMAAEEHDVSTAPESAIEIEAHTLSEASDTLTETPQSLEEVQEQSTPLAPSLEETPAAASPQEAPTSEQESADEPPVKESMGEISGPVQMPEPANASVEDATREIEMAAIVNDILSGDEDQEEQMAWYEYLDLEEPSHQVDLPAREAQDKPETTGNAPGEPDHLIQSEQPVAASHLNGTIPVSSTESGAEESSELEGWQPWETNASDDATLPLALKEIQDAQRAALTVPPQSPQESTTSSSEPDAKQERAEEEPVGAKMVSQEDKEENADELQQESEPTREPVQPLAQENDEEVAKSDNHEKKIEEQPTLLLQKIETPRSAVGTVSSPGLSLQEQALSGSARTLSTNPTRTSESATPVLASTDATPQPSAQPAGTPETSPPRPSTVTPTVKESKAAPPKRGFWWRLFHFGRKG